MQNAARFMYDPSCFADWLKCAGLVVRRHNRNQRRRARCKFAAQIVEIDRSGRGDGDGFNRVRRKPAAGQHGGMLDRGDQEPPDAPAAGGKAPKPIVKRDHVLRSAIERAAKDVGRKR